MGVWWAMDAVRGLDLADGRWLLPSPSTEMDEGRGAGVIVDLGSAGVLGRCGVRRRGAGGGRWLCRRRLLALEATVAGRPDLMDVDAPDARKIGSPLDLDGRWLKWIDRWKTRTGGRRTLLARWVEEDEGWMVPLIALRRRRQGHRVRTLADGLLARRMHRCRTATVEGAEEDDDGAPYWCSVFRRGTVNGVPADVDFVF
ncbi:hypothetical protein ACLOJK_000654 [Asimina triloba]